MPTSIYRGFAFPFQAGPTAFPAPSTDDDLIQQSLTQIVMTVRGERIMRPDFGSNAFSFVFEDNDDLLAELIQTEVLSAIGRFEPRVIVQGVIPTRNDTTVDVQIDYVVIATRQPGSVTVSLPSSTP